MKKIRLVFLLWSFVWMLLLAACGGSNEVTPTASAPASTPNPDLTTALPTTADISTTVPDSPTENSTDVPVSGTADIQSGPILSGDDFLPIDEFLSQIDNEVCQNAYETKAELEALIAEGADLAELEMALDELIEELENCPTPTPE